MIHVGAEEFGLHAPRYSQRAAAGESFLITRRGRPMARLLPVEETEPPELGELGTGTVEEGAA